jgi:CheY-like chemotaxis protein
MVQPQYPRTGSFDMRPSGRQRHDLSGKTRGGTPDAYVIGLENKMPMSVRSMPECNGYEATLVLRHDQRTSETVIVAFTALNDDGDVRKHLVNHSFDGYCQKGQSPTNLVALVMGFMR